MEAKILEVTTASDSVEEPANHSPDSSEEATNASTRARKLFPWIAALLLLFFVVQLGIHLTRTSVTYDEKVFIMAGYRYWKCGNYTVNPAHPPLAKLVAGFPLRLKTLIDPGCSAVVPTIEDGYLQADRFLIANGIDSVVIPARWAEVSFSLVLWTALLFGIRRMFGWKEALVATALLVCEPTLIAHGSLATTDMPIAATFFVAVLALYFFCEKPTVLRTIALGLAIGAALASKHTALPAMSLLFVLLLLHLGLAWRDRAPGRTAFGKHVLQSLCGFLIALALGSICLWGTYGFRYYALPDTQQESMPFKFQSLASKGLSSHLEPLESWIHSEHLFPESYVFGLGDILNENNSNSMVIFGKEYPVGAWYYFPIAFSIKTSLVLLVLLLAGLVQIRLYRKHAREMAFLLIPALGYFAFGMSSGLDIGIRHILPVYPFFIGISAAGACALATQYPKAWGVLLALLAFAALDSVRTLPKDIAFSNELWGGTNSTYKYLSDSNVDWGQTFKQVRSYIETHHVQQCWIAANGNPEIASAMLPCKLLPAPFQFMDRPIEDLPNVIDGTVFLSNEAFPDEFPGVYEGIVANKPVALIGGATFVYEGRFDITDAAVLVHSRDSQLLYSRGQISQAVDELAQAIALRPRDPSLHLAMGIYLVTAGQKDSARNELEACVKLTSGSGGNSYLQELAQKQLDAIR